MPDKKRGESPCRSCSTLTVVLIAVLTGVLPGGTVGERAAVPASTVAVATLS
jgi:hypothetical protein